MVQGTVWNGKGAKLILVFELRGNVSRTEVDKRKCLEGLGPRVYGLGSGKAGGGVGLTPSNTRRN